MSIGSAVEVMAEEEQLYGHKNAITLRLGAATTKYLQINNQVNPDEQL